MEWRWGIARDTYFSYSYSYVRSTNEGLQQYCRSFFIQLTLIKLEQCAMHSYSSNTSSIAVIIVKASSSCFMETKAA